MLDREWLSILDPADHHDRYLFDVSFLLSDYRCIYGQGCPGIGYEADPVLGCCAHGAHYVDDDDRRRVESAAAELDSATFDNIGAARRQGVSANVPGATQMRTRLRNDACIFLNRGERPGCALHHLAVDRGEHPMTTKPEVCWIVPLRREIAEDTADDGQPRVTTTITSYDRGAWGPGGADFGWWCTESAEAYVADDPVYRTMAAELVAMTSPAVYAELAAELERRRAASVTRPRLPVVNVTNS